MAHHKSTKPRTTGKQAACCICGRRDVPARMKREPPERGPYVCPGDCRDAKRKQDAEGAS